MTKVSRHECSCCVTPSRQWSCAVALLCSLLLIGLTSRPAVAETLEQALADAYLINPALNAERARLRATDEQVALAKSGMRPNINFTTSGSVLKTNTSRGGANTGTVTQGVNGASFSNGDGTTYPHELGFQLTQPLFEGFQNLNAIRQAKSTVQAAPGKFAADRTIRLAASGHGLCRCCPRHGYGEVA